jgi:hypothetical protein
MASPSSNLDQRLDCLETKLVKLNSVMNGEIRELFAALLSKMDMLITSQSPPPPPSKLKNTTPFIQPNRYRPIVHLAEFSTKI